MGFLTSASLDTVTSPWSWVTTASLGVSPYLAQSSSEPATGSVRDTGLRFANLYPCLW